MLTKITKRFADNSLGQKNYVFLTALKEDFISRVKHNLIWKHEKLS